MNDSVDDGDGDGDGDYIGPTQCNEGVPGAPSSEAPTSESRDYICLNEDLYDSCFGVVSGLFGVNKLFIDRIWVDHLRKLPTST